MAYKSRPVIQYDIDGKEVAWHPTLAEAAKAAGVTKAAMSIFLSGKRKTPVCAGFVWKYAPEISVVPQQEVSVVPQKRELPVNPHSDEYKWMNFRQRIQSRTALEQQLQLKRDHETRNRNKSQDS